MYTRSFKAWLKKQSFRDDPVGDLAVDAKADHDLPDTFEEMREHLERRSACAGARGALEQAWSEFAADAGAS